VSTFTGKAIYDDGVFNGVAEDVANLVSMISPSDTPLLAALGDAPYPAANVLHEWLEDKLTPDTLTASGTMINSTNQTSLAVHSNGDAVGDFIPVGAQVKCNGTGEYLRVTASAGNTVTFARAQYGTTIASVVAGETFTVISRTALEGADVAADISRPRSRVTNYCEIMKSDIIVSGTTQAVTQLGGITNEFDYQKLQRTKEAVRDLEKAVIMGKSSGNTLGSASAYRTMKGIWDFLTTNSTSVATLTAAGLNDVVYNAYSYGATDVNLIVADPLWAILIDTFNTSRLRLENTDQTFRNKVTLFGSSFGDIPVVMSRWMPSKSVMALSRERVNVVPLQGRSFQYVPVARTGDAEKGMVVGEYTVEVRNEEGCAKAYG